MQNLPLFFCLPPGYAGEYLLRHVLRRVLILEFSRHAEFISASLTA